MLQDKGYFEAKVLAPGSFAIGVAIKDSPLDGVLSPDKAANAWTITHNQSGVGPVAAGDVLGCAIDQVRPSCQLRPRLQRPQLQCRRRCHRCPRLLATPSH